MKLFDKIKNVFKGNKEETVLNYDKGLKKTREEFISELSNLSIKYKCDCSKEKFSETLATLHKDEIKAMIEEDGQAEICCQFCDKKYIFNKDELTKLL